MRNLEIKHLRMVRMIAGTGNLTRAAENLHISQPALSQQLKDIEERLGTALFIRTGRCMVLTPVGKKLLPYSNKILDTLEEAELEVEKAVSGQAGELKIGVRCLFCYKWIPDVVKAFQEKFPNVELHIGNSFEPEKDLVSKAFDIAVSTAPVMNRDLAFTPLFEDEFVCAMSSDHAMSSKKYLDIDDFNGADMISMVEKSGPSFYNFYLKNRGVRPRKYMTITHADALVELVEAGLGIAVLPRWFISPYTIEKQITTCGLTSKRTVSQWKASYLKGRRIPAYEKAFIRLMASPFSTLTPAEAL